MLILDKHGGSVFAESETALHAALILQYLSWYQITEMAHLVGVPNMVCMESRLYGQIVSPSISYINLATISISVSKNKRLHFSLQSHPVSELIPIAVYTDSAGQI